ncbi:MAG: hypothetical protein K0Q70_1470, partial [Rhodospirillales bacterium]|nr:hypothetical protein [Rhodospirillales bacterium]
MQPFLLPIAYFLSAVGWGRLVVAWALPNTPLYPALSAALGLVLVAFVGGVFTAAHAITPTVLDALVVI